SRSAHQAERTAASATTFNSVAKPNCSQRRGERGRLASVSSESKSENSAMTSPPLQAPSKHRTRADRSQFRRLPQQQLADRGGARRGCDSLWGRHSCLPGRQECLPHGTRSVPAMKEAHAVGRADERDEWHSTQLGNYIT